MQFLVIDTFLFNDAGKIVRQTVCILNEGAPACKAPLCTEPQGGPVQASWDNHFAAFGGQDVDKVLKDYTEKSVIKVYNQVTDELVEFKGLKAVKECFTGLFLISPTCRGSPRPRSASRRPPKARRAWSFSCGAARARSTTTRPTRSSSTRTARSRSRTLSS